MKPSASFQGMIDRREMLRHCLRGSAVASLLGIVGWLAARTLRGGCAKAHPCGECPLLSGCDLPQAQAHKQAAPPRHG